MDIPTRGRSRTRRRRTPASWILRDCEFLELVRGAWVQGVQQVEIEVAKARAKENCDRVQAVQQVEIEVTNAGAEEDSDRTVLADVRDTSPRQPSVDAVGPVSPQLSCAVSDGCAGAQLFGWAHLPTCDVPEEVSKAVRACCGDQPALLAGLPLIAFWHQVRRMSRKEDPLVVLQRMLGFRSKYKWPLTICVADVSKAIGHSVFQYLPPQPPRHHPLLMCSLQNMDTKTCSVEEYQKLAMLMMEAAFRASAEDARGLIILVDLRGISSSLARSVLTSITDLTRGVAMCSGSLPACVSHVHLIEGGSQPGFLKAILSMLFSGLSTKVLSRVSRGDPKTALETIGAQDLPRSLGGDRDADSEWRAWLGARRAQEVASGLLPAPQSRPPGAG